MRVHRHHALAVTGIALVTAVSMALAGRPAAVRAADDVPVITNKYTDPKDHTSDVTARNVFIVVVTPKHKPAAAPSQPGGPPKNDPGHGEGGGD
jgi:hypothetical protein